MHEALEDRETHAAFLYIYRPYIYIYVYNRPILCAIHLRGPGAPNYTSRVVDENGRCCLKKGPYYYNYYTYSILYVYIYI